ncbi:MAG TPA: pantoate--beta-alanine ligase [Chitinophagaceae bacterium]|nr:pantoate--beta-alanine ligase [Chitinophagaceae bacterium]
MILFKKATDLRNWVDAQRKKDDRIGFVPTMGALHDGHISLIDASKKKDKISISSIFVNPTQFNDPKDFKKYPVTLEKDIDMLEKAGCDILFLPSVEEIYPDGFTPKMHYDLGFLETVLEGKYRPGHFQGVCMVVHRLLEIVNPDHLYLGQKDYQQCMVLTRLVELIGLKNKTEIIICPTLREADGLAMSSRNMRLNEMERKNAVTIYQCLNMIKEKREKISAAELISKAQLMLEKTGFKVDYVEIADARNLSPVNTRDGKQKLVALIAATMNEVRLIDNMVI